MRLFSKISERIYDRLEAGGHEGIPRVRMRPAIPGRVRTAPKDTRVPKSRRTLHSRATSAIRPAPW